MELDWPTILSSVVAGLVGGLCGICGAVFGALVTAGLALARSWTDRRWRGQDARAAEERGRVASRMEDVREYVISLRECVSSGLRGRTYEAELRAGGDRDEIKGRLEAAYWEARERAAAADRLRARAAPDLALKDVEEEPLLTWLEMRAVESQYYLGGLLLDEDVHAPSTNKEEVDTALSKLLEAIDRVPGGSEGK